MSSSLSVYLLDLNATHALVGSRDDALLETVRTRFAADLAHDDDWFDSEIENGAPRAYEALRAVVHGGPFSEDREHAFQYAYAYKRLCDLTGSFLDNSSFSPYRGDWLSMVDAGLRALKIDAVSVEEFDFSGLPAGLPSTYTPGCGEWTYGECVKALEQFEETKRQGNPPLLEREVAEAVQDVLGWLRQVEARPGFGIVGFRS
ncbi:hypothetical protein ACIPW5_12865 [Streptomyces sp. NPDC090077]|uniref:DUF7691 family protein n=1 Tax=Streptomyces sp. NPDC090077 TaxID=3365938 RepID=UPI0037FF0A6A